MIQDSIFKAYDIRGKYPGEINEEVAGEIVSRFFSLRLTNLQTYKPKTIVIGHDARLSSPILYKAVLDLLTANSSKLKTIGVGLITTPMMYFLVNRHNADFGIMITASHNPKEYNGIKMVGKKAAPISGKEIYKIISNF